MLRSGKDNRTPVLIPPPGVEKIEWPRATMWVEDGIYCSVSKPGRSETPEEMQEHLDQLRSMTKGRKICLLIDMTCASESDRETREFAAREFPSLIHALAIVSRSALGKMVANIFFTVKTQPYPSRHFTDPEEAKKWLKLYM